MSEALINIIIQVISGALGGNAVGKASPKIDLGGIGNTIAGAIGGGIGGQIIAALLAGGGTAAAGGGLDIGNIVTQVVGGGASGAIVTAIVGFIRQYLNKSK